MRRISTAFVTGYFSVLSGCAPSPKSVQSVAQTAEAHPGLFLIATNVSTGNPVPAKDEERHAISFDQFRELGARGYAEPTSVGGAMVGAGVGALTGLAATKKLRGALIGAVAGGVVGGTVRDSAQRDNARRRADLFYTMLQEGYVPVHFFDTLFPPSLVRIILHSTPDAAKLFIRSSPTSYQTISDLYMLPDDIHSATLELPGYAPCRIADAIVPGLPQPGGFETLNVRCSLAPLATSKTMPRRVR